MRIDEDRSMNARRVSAAIAPEDLGVVLRVHRDNCRQIDCPILAALEDRADALGTPGATC
jgi:hypothetical protein